MMGGKGLRCSFCGRDESQVQKLVAGPKRVFICDDCVSVAKRIMDSSSSAERKPRAVPPSAPRRFSEWVQRFFQPTIARLNLSKKAIRRDLGLVAR
jgi:ATP-dependent protease Clp ATPase subunit